MTLPHERTRAVIQTGEFLEELQRDQALPDHIRKAATFLLRHYPSASQVFRAAQHEIYGPGLLFEPVFWTSVELPEGPDPYGYRGPATPRA